MAGSGSSPATVQEWLQSLYLEQFVNDFLFSGYTDLSKCCHITEADLVRLGITQVGYQKRILSRLPSEADAFIMEFSPSGPISNGNVLGQPGQPIPTPRTKKPAVAKTPSIDNVEYMEVAPSPGGMTRSSSCKPMLSDRSRSDGDMLSQKGPQLPEDLAPRSQKPVPKPRAGGRGAPRRDPPPPLPKRGTPIPPPRASPTPPETLSVLQAESSVDPVIPDMPSLQVQDTSILEEQTPVKINPFSEVENQFDPLFDNPFNPFNSGGDLSSRPVPVPPPSPTTGIDLSTRPVPPPPIPEPAATNFLLNRPVPRPPEDSEETCITSFKGGDDDPLDVTSPPPPLPVKKALKRPPRSRSEPANLDEYLKTVEPPSLPPPSIAEEDHQLPVLPPRPGLSSNNSPVKSIPTPSETPLNEDAMLLRPDNVVKMANEVNANVEMKDAVGSLLLDDLLLDPLVDMNQGALSTGSSRKSDHSSRSSQDDTLMVPAGNWPDSDLPGMSMNQSNTMSSVGSSESSKIMSVIDEYSQSDLLTPSQGSVPSPNSSLNHEDMYDELRREEDIYGELWNHESRPVSENLTNLFKNPPPDDEVSYLSTWDSVSGHPRPPSQIDAELGMPSVPPPPLPALATGTAAAPVPVVPSMDSPPPMAMPQGSPPPPPIPSRPAPPPPPGRIDSLQTAAPAVAEDILIQLGDDHKKEMDDGYDFLEPSLATFPSLSSSLVDVEEDSDDVLVLDFEEGEGDSDSDEGFPITLPDTETTIDSGISRGFGSDPFDRSSALYASIRQSVQPYMRKVPEEARRRLSMRVSTSQSKGLTLVKLEKSGYLWKCGAGRQGRGGFRKRWFVFNGKELRYYENEKTMTTCKGIIPVGTMLDVKHLHKTSIGDKKSRIELMTNARTYYLATDSCDDGTIWANMLMQAILGFKAPPGGFPKGGDMSCPDKEGYLKMEGCNQKRYFAIKGEILCYYSSDKDFEAAVPITDLEMKLANAKINIQKPERIILNTPSTTYHLTADTPEEAKEWVDAMMEAVLEGLSDKLYLHRAWENEANQLCADCNMSDPDWCSLNFGIVICKKCSGIHRQLGVHVSKVRSLKMDVKAFTDTALEVFAAVGNRVSNNFWEMTLDPMDGVKPMPDDSVEQRKMFIVKKYMDRQYCEQILWEREEVNKELLKAVQAGNLKDCLRFIFSGANVEAVNDDGVPARDLAYGHDQSPVIREMLDQNKEYSAHQQELVPHVNQPTPATLLPSPSPTLHHGQTPHPQHAEQPRPKDPDTHSQGSPVPPVRLHQKKTSDPALQDSGRGSPVSQGSPTIPHRPAPPPPKQASPEEALSSSMESKQELIHKAGFLYKTGSNRKDFLKRYCVLDHGTFSYYQDDKALQAKNVIEGTDMVYVAIGASKQGHEFNFEMGTCLGRLFLFAAEDEADRRNWMSALVKFHTPECMWSDCNDYEYAGFLRKKVGRASTGWQRIWFLLKGKQLSYFSAEKDGMEVIDLRKAIEITHDMEEGSKDHVKDVAIVVKGRTIYLRADTQSISDAWMAALQKNASKVGPELEDQFLTEEHIPYILKECIEFVYIHQGLEQQGIYRLSGTASKIQRIREMFKTNPMSVRIDRDEFQVNDVTSALKKFFRELPDPVLTKEWYQKWIEVSGYTNHSVKLEWYKYILGQLPKVHYCTLKTIIAHLIRVRENERVNKMTDKNLASVFGPTLMALPDSTFGNAEKEIAVIGDLMTYFQWLFDVDDKVWEEESKKVKKMTQFHAHMPGVVTPKQSKAIVMPFYIGKKIENRSITLPVQETMTAKEVVETMVKTHNLPSLDGNPWALFEVIDNGEIERMLFDYEVVLTEVSAWDPSMAANNYLCIMQNRIINDMQVFLKNSTSSASIKYSDSSRKFKDFYFEISGNIMRFCKSGARGSGAPNYWDIVPLKIYMGINSKHKKSAPTRWGISFLAPGEKDFKCMCFDSEGVRTMWLAGLFRCKLSSAAAYTSNLQLTDPSKRSPLSTFEQSNPLRERTTSFGVLRDNVHHKGKSFLQSVRRRQPSSASSE